MPGEIQIIPPGLLGFFQIKNAGKNPTQLGDTLVPVIQAFDWYMQSRAVDWAQDRGGGTPGQVAVANGAVGFTPFSPNAIIVPANEYWWVEEFTVTTNNLIATDTVAVGCGLRRPLLGTLNFYLLGALDGRTGSAAGRRAFASARGFFAPAGSELGAFISTNETATSITYTGYVRFTPLPV